MNNNRWLVLGGATIGLIFGLSTFLGISFSIFLKPLSEEFGWSRAEISLSLTITTIIIIVLGPVIGKLMDKYSVRRILLPSILFFGLSVASLNWLSSTIFHLYLVFGLIAVVGAATLPVSYTKVILGWFDKKRGIALGIALTGVGIGAVFLPPTLQWTVSNYGWRHAYLLLAALVILVSFPLIYKLLIEVPPTNSNHSHYKNDGVSGYSVRQALANPTFWLLVIMFLLLGLATVGTSVHLMSLFTDRNVSPENAALTMSLLGVALIIGRIGGGFLIDRFFAPLVAAFFFTGATLGFILLASGATGVQMSIAVILLGLGFGAEFDLLSYFVSRYLGLKSYAQIYSYIYGAFSLGAGFGPLLLGWSFDQNGNYTQGLYLFSAFAATATILLYFLGKYPVLPIELS